MMSAETNKGVDEIEAGFLYDLTEATVALFYLLQGMEIASQLYEEPQENEGERVIAGPYLAHLKTFPCVSTTGLDMLGPMGVAVQLAFKGWVADIYHKWERSRHKTKELIGEEGIPPEVDCMGDFRHIRNDLVHSGYGTEKESGKCKVLKWFKPGERMMFTTEHVFDLLNQMNLIVGPTPISNPTGKRICAWELLPDAMESTMPDEQLPRLISFRLDVDEDGKHGSQRRMISYVFADGTFCQTEVEVPISTEQYLEGTLDGNGDIIFAGGHVLSARDLYHACFGFLKGELGDGPGIMGPPARYYSAKQSEQNDTGPSVLGDARASDMLP